MAGRRSRSSVIKDITSIKGEYNTRVTFTDGSKAEYNLSKSELEAFKRNPSGSFYNKNIRITQGNPK